MKHKKDISARDERNKRKNRMEYPESGSAYENRGSAGADITTGEEEKYFR